MIRTFRSGPLGIEKDKPLPSRMVVMPWGESVINKGEILRVNETTLRELPANQARVNFDRVALDFNHNTVEGSKAYQGEPAKVAAYASPAVVAGEGLVYEDIQYTPEGEAALRGGHYIDFSPAVKTNSAGEVTFVHSTAICRQGQIRGLSIFSAADPFGDDHNPNDKNTMDPKKLLLTLLCLSADASDTEIEAAAKKAGELPDTLQTLSATVDAQADTIKTLSADLKTLQGKAETVSLDAAAADQLKTLSAQVADLVERDEYRERSAIKNEAIAQGKIVPLSAEKMELEAFRTLCSELPADQVPVERRTPEHIKVLSSQPDSGADVVRGALGISEDDWEKHNS